MSRAPSKIDRHTLIRSTAVVATTAKPSQKPRKKKADRLEQWAAIEILPWVHSATPGPSREQWDDWGKKHGAMLRIACGEMMLTKESLTALAEALDPDGQFDGLVADHEASIKFFTDMAKTIEAAKLRLLVGSAVYALRIQDSGKVAS